MANLREVLEKLPAEVLAGMAEEAGVGSPHADGLEKLGAGRVKVLLADLPRAALKEACRALGLDDSGREKLLFVDRLIPGGVELVGPGESAPAAMARTTRKQKKAGNGAALGFEATLWLAADKLRNNLDAAEDNRQHSLPPHAI